MNSTDTSNDFYEMKIGNIIESAEKRKWCTMGRQFYGHEVYDFDCIYIIALPTNFNFKKLNNKIFETPNNVCVVDIETNEKINNYTIHVN